TGGTANGSVTLSTDGSFRYYPAPGFTGKDTFTYTYNNYLGESETCTVEITVE
ncbi:MAG: cadherin-like domain-containing protein, partial [Clostridia bacterium]|nr:cadherin-like domain-containing protein [Clostridia bacterium]